MHTLNRAWRVLATAIAFCGFGLGGLVLRLVYFPLLGLLVRDPVRRREKARRAVQRSFGVFIELMRVLGLLTYEVHGLERLRRAGLLILANHPTLIDVVFLVSLVDNADCVVKAALGRNPFTRGPVEATGYIQNHAGGQLVDDCIASLRAGSNLIIFPEGTRSRPGEPLRLQRGAAQIAVRGVRDITPVHISCAPLSLTKGMPWWQVPKRPMHFVVKIGADVAIQPFLARTQGESALAARQVTEHLHDLFSATPQGDHAGTRT
jgi:1-acyl-sn-glycerol-3-phosphate acyltransferase